MKNPMEERDAKPPHPDLPAQLKFFAYYPAALQPHNRRLVKDHRLIQMLFIQITG